MFPYFSDTPIFLASSVTYPSPYTPPPKLLQINPTMNGGGRSVLIWGRMCRTLLVDKGKPLSGDKGTRTDEHGPKIQQGRMARVLTNIYAYGFGRSEFGHAVSGKRMILWKRRPKFVCVPLAHYFW